MIRAIHYINDIENVVAIEYTHEDVFIRLQIPSYHEAKELHEQLGVAIENMRYYEDYGD